MVIFWDGVKVKKMSSASFQKTEQGTITPTLKESILPNSFLEM